MGITLPDDTTNPLHIVHWTDRHVEIYEKVQTLLHINSDTEFFSSTHYYSNVAIVHAPEKSRFLFVCVVVVDNSDLFGSNTCSNEFPLYVLKDIEPPVAALVRIAEDSCGTLIVVGGFQIGENLPHGIINLAARFIRKIGIYQPNVNSCTLCQPEHHQRDMAVFPLLFRGHSVETFKRIPDAAHDFPQGRGLIEHYICRLTPVEARCANPLA